MLMAIAVLLWTANLIYPAKRNGYHEMSGPERERLLEAARSLRMQAEAARSVRHDSLQGRRQWEVKKWHPSNFPKRGPKSPDMPVRLVELNAADSATLEKLPGIGPVLASRIVRYRDRLGGFHTTAQLLEVYGLKPEWLQRFSERISVDPSTVKPLDFQQAEFRDLARHPYVGYELTRTIFRLRRQERLPEDATELCRALGLSDSLSMRLRPYLPH
ncbi:MAG TPA: helix-hairpin-helix domain-containing protein [Bacteroidales bacterium]|nr:helix-hairpin-helix domain-containing protein [Bacteroidales bacterium]